MSEFSRGVKDLVIDLNVPQVTREVKDNKIDLHALHVYDDGHFMLASNNISWESSNQTVASVNQDGEVTVTGQNGKTLISINDGRYNDRISLQYKGNQGDKEFLQKEEGER